MASTSPAMNRPVSLDSVILTPELERRPARSADHELENRALVDLMRVLKTADGDILQALAETTLRLCRGHSAGISIAEEENGRAVFRWHGAAGRWSAFLHGTMPRSASPCGVVLDRNMPLLMRYPEHHFVYPQGVDGAPPIAETLLVPFEVAGRTVGTVWVIAHDETRKFDREDLRIMRSLSELASVGYQVIQQRKQLTESLERELSGSRLLQSVSAGVILENDAGALYGEILDAAICIMKADCASLQMIDEDGNLQLLAWRGFDSESARAWRTIQYGSATGCATALRARERVIIPDIEHYLPAGAGKTLDEYRRLGVGSMQSTPLISRGDKLIGIVSTHWRCTHTPSPDALRILDILARETADLIERMSTEQELRDADRRKNEFLAVLGHELRNPLAALGTAIELLNRAAHDAEVVRSVHARMKRQLSHVSRLVDDLLDLSRIARGEIELRRAPVDMQVVIDTAIELTRPVIEERRHRLAVENCGGTITIEGDLERLTQVVANLLSNASKYMDPGGEISVCCLAEADDAVVRVRDCGYGIPADRLSEIFEMFSQVPEHRARAGGAGLGIGLALSRRLIERHGGTISATSAGFGKGSEFTVRLPRNSHDEL